MKKNLFIYLGFFAAFFCITHSTKAQVSLTGATTYTQNFNSFNGTFATLPTGWTAVGAERSINCGSTNQGGCWSYQAGASGEGSLGFLGSGSATSCVYTGSFVNNTGSTITQLVVGYNFE